MVIGGGVSSCCSGAVSVVVGGGGGWRIAVVKKECKYIKRKYSIIIIWK